MPCDLQEVRRLFPSSISEMIQADTSALLVSMVLRLTSPTLMHYRNSLRFTDGYRLRLIFLIPFHPNIVFGRYLVQRVWHNGAPGLTAYAYGNGPLSGHDVTVKKSDACSIHAIARQGI